MKDDSYSLPLTALIENAPAVSSRSSTGELVREQSSLQ